MRLKAQNEMAGVWPHAAMGPVERMVRRNVLCDGSLGRGRLCLIDYRGRHWKAVFCDELLDMACRQIF